MHRIWLSAVLATSLFSVPVYSADALFFDLMQIEQVIGGVNGDTTAQAIQLRMRCRFQNLLNFARMRAFDATGSNPVLLIDFTTDVPNDGTGVRVLITSRNFDGLTSPVALPDYTMTNLIPPSYLAAGSITFEDDWGIIYWRLSWGGNDYTGPTTGDIANDADGDFGPPWPGPLPAGGVVALQFQGPANAQSTNNAADYALTRGAAVFINNAAQSFALTEPSVADISGPLGPGFPDGCVDAFDLGTLLGAWCSAASDPDPPGDVDPPCEGCTSPNFALADITGPGGVPDGCVDAFDLGALLAAWCSVAGGNPCGTCFP
ncbi:MAG: hypothetical protein IH830_12295 [Planctomycetes bacterium]|nr:hypothetical protein [Planctomycetota bacterium]